MSGARPLPRWVTALVVLAILALVLPRVAIGLFGGTGTVAAAAATVVAAGCAVAGVVQLRRVHRGYPGLARARAGLLVVAASSAWQRASSAA